MEGIRKKHRPTFVNVPTLLSVEFASIYTTLTMHVNAVLLAIIVSLIVMSFHVRHWVTLIM